MKDKILIFIIGLLVGAIITAAGFLIYEKTNKNTNQTQNGDRMQMMAPPDGQMPSNGQMPPELPEDMKNGTNRPELPSSFNEE